MSVEKKKRKRTSYYNVQIHKNLPERTVCTAWITWGSKDFKCLAQHINSVTVYELSNSHDGKIHPFDSGHGYGRQALNLPHIWNVVFENVLRQYETILNYFVFEKRAWGYTVWTKKRRERKGAVTEYTYDYSILQSPANLTETKCDIQHLLML